LIEAHVLVRAIRRDAAGHFGGEIKERANGPTGLFASPELQNLAKQNEDRNDRRGLEIDGDRPVVPAHGDREQSWAQGSDDAEGPRHTRAHGNEGVHVEIARPERGPGALEER
jgi:hypothetical protein